MREENTTGQERYTSDVRLVDIENRRIFIIGTAHISKQSANLVREVIETEKPDTVCVELDEKRFQALSEKSRWEELDLKSLIKQKQLSTLLINILLSSYQKKLGEKLGVTPGIELLEAAKTTKEMNIPIELCDREVRITLRRAWNSMSFFQKLKLISSGFAGIFEEEEITEERLEEIKQKDVLSELMNELGKSMPVLKKVLIDERDAYLATKILESKGDKVVAVVGAGHVDGIEAALKERKKANLKEIEIIPPMSPLWKWIGWGIPAIIIASIFYIGFDKGISAAGNNALYWVLANGIPCAFGAIIALANPITIITAFISAPFTSLTPLIGAGYVTAFVQAYYRPPIVREIQTVTNDISKPVMWWKNKLLRVFLVFILTGLGSALGTYVGAYKIVSNLFN